MIQTDGYFNYKYIDLWATPKQAAKAKAFAMPFAKSVVQHYGKTRNQSDVNLIAAQAVPSKTFEYMVYNYLSQYGHCTEPDINIYKNKQKSFDSDLTFTQTLPDGEPRVYKIHVKCQDHATIKDKDYISWGFQMTDPLYKNPQEDDYVITGIYMDPEVGRLLIKRKAKDVMSLAADPKKLAFRGNKKFLYLKDVERKTDPLGPRL